jgi:hypothetical protein
MVIERRVFDGQQFRESAAKGPMARPGERIRSAFFSALPRVAGIRASQAQMTTALRSLMLSFWVFAICRMMLIITA